MKTLLALFLCLYSVSCDECSGPEGWSGPSATALTPPDITDAGGMFYNDEKRALVYTDRNTSTVYRKNMDKGNIDHLKIDPPGIEDGQLAFVYPIKGKDSFCLVGKGNHVCTINETDGEYGSPHEISDTKDYCISYAHADLNGVLWITLNSESGNKYKGGQLYNIKNKKPKKVKQYKKHLGDFAWSYDYAYLYVVGDFGKTIYKYDFDESSTVDLKSEKVFYKVPKYPDMQITGIDVGKDDYVWITIKHHGLVMELDPKGRVNQIARMPATQLRGITFGGDGLFVSTSKECTTNEQAAGSVLSLSDSDATGIPDAFVAW